MKKNKRRQFVTSSIITGSAVTALPNKWLKPLISTVMLPAHAQTSIINNSASVAPVTSSDEAESCNPGASSPTEFIFTGSSQEFIVPSGITSLDITAIAGEGGGGAAGHGGFPLSSDSRGGTGSMGQTVSKTVSVSPCEALRIVVGGGGGGGCSYGYRGDDGSDGGAGSTYFGITGGDGGSGYNNSNGTGVGGTRGPAANGTIITTSTSGSNGADGSITLIF